MRITPCDARGTEIAEPRRRCCQRSGVRLTEN
jgi:hypothetical protein